MAFCQTLSSAVSNSGKDMNLLCILFCIFCIHLIRLQYTESCNMVAKGYQKSLAFQQPGHCVWLLEEAFQMRLFTSWLPLFFTKKRTWWCFEFWILPFLTPGLLPVELYQGLQNNGAESSHLAQKCEKKLEFSMEKSCFACVRQQLQSWWFSINQW